MTRPFIRTSMGRALVAGAAFLGVFQTAIESTHACSFAGNRPHTVDPQAQATDSTPPGSPTVSIEATKRGKGPEGVGCSQSASSCDDLGYVGLQVTAADDQTTAENLGYRLELASGSLPSGLSLPPDAVRSNAGKILLVWIDGNSDDQEPLSFSLAVRAVDLAGNVGPPVTIQVSDAGSDGGCTVAMQRTRPSCTPTTVVVLLAVGLLRRRRARSAGSGKR